VTPRYLIALVLLLVLVVATWVLLRGFASSSDAFEAASNSGSDATHGRAAPARAPSVSNVATPPPARPPEGASADDSLFSSLFPTDDPAWAWSRVDLDALREAMPDNTFWELAAPTDDPAVLEARRAHKDRLNRALGRVMSNTGTEAEVRSYYEERERISSDYVTFMTRLLDAYGDVLPERDRGFAALARDMHRARLEEMPRHLREALDRREAHAAAREAWLAEEALFAVDPESGTPE